MSNDTKFLLTLLTVIIIWDLFIKPIDPTDLSRWDRSGMLHYIDYGTGCEYLAGSGFFGKEQLIPRVDKNGKHICNRGQK